MEGRQMGRASGSSEPGPWQLTEPRRRSGLALILLATLVGCATVDVVPADTMHGQSLTDGEATPIAHVTTSNWGWYLFKSIPLATGNPEKPGNPQWPVPLHGQRDSPASRAADDGEGQRAGRHDGH
jgi:hypothetical protein